ncbi:hypothetical protein [Alkalicoccus saliphilus]|uniref:Uncharacterized protein n=1 Tax=Alkalicoccus saliphilus TaxID=200989 RepID=A0A2T4U6T4_9BACI|nr:hypothetical protein [Alkalicoccus saliphilus]PTL39101.1 hypothetical protein C6Y45_07945 [Alkalicoccus saliphilus]
MKKFIIGTFAFGMILTGGMTGVSAQSGEMDMREENSGHINMEEMHQHMMGSNAVINFGQAKKMMKEMHPNMSTKQVKAMYKEHHGTMGAEPRANFNEMDHMEQN